MTATLSPRISHVARDAWTDEVRDVFAIYEGQAGWENGSKINVIQLFANHPSVAQGWLSYNRALVNGVLDKRLQELAILRVADRYKCAYEWDQHVLIAKGYGVTEAEIAAVREGPDAATWGAVDRVVLRVADQLCEHSDIDDATWSELAGAFNNTEILELLFTIGTYSMLSWIFRATRLQPEYNVQAEDKALDRA